MCGLIAVSRIKRWPNISVDAIDSLKHRGPDDSGFFSSVAEDCQLGHTRLAIMDLSELGKQPMADGSGRFTIVFNGEIYNFLELKKRLDSLDDSINWRSASDTEVIVEGYAREGAAFLSALNGIFAVAIYDNLKNTLCVLRDPLGVKPLYALSQDGAVVFASEIKAIRSLVGVKTTIRKQSLADVLALMYVPEPNTMFNEIVKVKPGVFYEYRKGSCIRSTPLFDSFEKANSINNEREAVDAFGQAFTNAVKRQIAADVPVSILLSGGLDSSAVAVEARDAGGAIRNAFTIATQDKDRRIDGQSDDLYYSRMVADQLKIDLHVIEAAPNLINYLPQLSQYMEGGIADPAAVNTFLICEHAREQGVKVMLSGQGADEYLGGYRRYLAATLFQRTPSFLLSLAPALKKVMPPNPTGRMNEHFRRLNRVLDLASQPEELRLLSTYVWTRREDLFELFLDSDSLKFAPDHANELSKLNGRDILQSMMVIDQKYDLRSLNLSYTDKLSMAAGVEARVPFLDFELVKVMNSIPSRFKVKGLTQKYLLKRAMESKLPEEIIHRRKAGFSLPIRSWLNDSSPLLDYYFRKEKIRSQGVFSFEKIEKVLDEQRAGVRDNAYLIFSLLVIQIWLSDEM